MGDMTKIVLLTALTCLVTALLGAIALQVLRGRSLLWSIVVAALVPLLAVTASVILNVQLMFISAHDSTAVSIALGCATVIGVLLSFVLGRRVATSSRQLTSALRDLAGPRGPASQRATSTPPRSAAPAEITALAEELDVTRDRLESAERQARAVEDSRRELVAFMSHDLRTPLAGLRALAEGLEDGVVDDQPGALRQMRQTVERMNGLVNDLFELSRLQAGTSGAGQQPGAMVSVLELSHDIVGELSAHAKQRGVALVLEAPPDDDRLAVHGNGEELGGRRAHPRRGDGRVRRHRRARPRPSLRRGLARRARPEQRGRGCRSGAGHRQGHRGGALRLSRCFERPGRVPVRGPPSRVEAAAGLTRSVTEVGRSRPDVLRVRRPASAPRRHLRSSR